MPNDTTMRLPIGDVTIAIPKGDHLSLTMPNGYSVSITRTAMTYCGGDTAETAIISPTGQFVAYDGDDVQGWQDVPHILATIAHARSL